MMHEGFFGPWFLGRGFSPFMWVWGIVIFGLIITGIVYSLKLIVSSASSNNRRDSNCKEELLFKLKERYASGEINNKDEFEKMQKELL
ncbi:MAG: SHOCT domain-containing protein [Promethearchaeota archaeon]